MLGAGLGPLLSPLRPSPLETLFVKVSDCVWSKPGPLLMTQEASGQSTLLELHILPLWFTVFERFPPEGFHLLVLSYYCLLQEEP